MNAVQENTLKPPEHKPDENNGSVTIKKLATLTKPSAKEQEAKKPNVSSNCGLKTNYFRSCLSPLILVVASSQIDTFLVTPENAETREQHFLKSRIGFIIGNVAGSFLMDQLGRVITMLLISILYIICALTYIVLNEDLLITIISIPFGFCEVTILHYTVEVSPTVYRPMFSSCIIISDVVGVLIQKAAEFFHEESRQLAMSVCCFLCFIYFILSSIGQVIESPRWLNCKKEETKTYDAVVALYGKRQIPPDVFPYTGVPSTYESALPLVTVSLCVMSSTFAIIMHTYSTFITFALKNMEWFSGAYSIALAISFGWLTGPRVRHNVLVVFSTLFILANYTIFFCLRDTAADKKDPGVVSVIAALLVSGAIAAAFKQTQLLKMAVLYPIKSKGTWCAWPFVVYNFITIVLVLTVHDDAGNFNSWFINAVACVLCCLVIIYWIPETQEKTLEQIHLELKKKTTGEQPNSTFSQVLSRLTKT